VLKKTDGDPRLPHFWQGGPHTLFLHVSPRIQASTPVAPRAAVDPRAVLPGTGFVVRSAKAAARYRYSLRRMEVWREAWRGNPAYHWPNGPDRPVVYTTAFMV